MLPELSGLWAKIETRHQEMFDLIDELKPKQLLFKPEPDRWTMLQVLQHVVLGAQGMRRSEAEMRDNPLREILKPGEMVKLVMDVLVKDVPVDVPDPSMDPDGKVTVEELRAIWRKERRALAVLLETVTVENQEQVMFSHAAAGPLTALQMLEIAEAHLGTHRRQMDRIRSELPAQ
ncbi:MAG: DinB family protein [Desulfobacterales bacterium]